MKKRHLITALTSAITAALFTLLLMSSSSCVRASEFESFEVQSRSEMEVIRLNGSEYLKIVEYEGHEYIIYDGYEAGGITHSESCPCK